MKCASLILFLLMISVVVADEGQIETYKPNEVFYLGIHLTNTTGNVLGGNCSVQIKNNSYDTILDDNLNEIGDGWYNYTYNTSDTGKFFCRQNCTQGTLFVAETCDFIIEGDENMGITIAIIIIGVAALFFMLSFFTDAKKHIALKIFFLWIAMIIILIGLNYAYLNSVDNGASENVQTLLVSLYRVGLYSFVIFAAYTVIYFVLWPTFIHFKQYGKHGKR